MAIIEELIKGGVNSYIIYLIDSAISLFTGVLGNIMSSANEILSMDIVTQAILYTQGLAATLLIIKVAFDALTVHILRSSGDPEANPGGLLIGAVQSAALIGSIPWLVKWIYQIGTSIAYDISALPGIDYRSTGDPLKETINTINMSQNFPLFILIVVIFCLLLLVIIFIQSFIRAADLALLSVLGAIMALGFRSQLFSTWWRELISVSMAQAIQILLIKLSFGVLQMSLVDDQFYNLLLFIGFLWVTVKSPSVLKQYIHSTGVGRVAGGAAQQVGTMVVMRRMFTKGV